MKINVPLKLTVFLIGLVLLSTSLFAQVKIGNNPNSINSNSLLELESSDKGFLPPRVALNDLNSISPLTGTVPAGMLVYSNGGSLVDGFYYWNGTAWKQIGTTASDLIVKNATCSLNQTEKFVLASNDITITLPNITAADNGLEITIKNIGSHTDLVVVEGSSGATIDGLMNCNLTKHIAQIFVAFNGNWLIRSSKKYEDFIMDIDEYSSWTTIQEAIEFLDEHMSTPVIIRLTDAEYEITETITIDLPFPVTIQGLAYGHASIVSGSGLSNKPMFRCISDCYFKMLEFDATTVAGYGTHAGEDAIRLLGTNTYHEIKDCTFEGFYNTILDSSNAELWLFECDIYNAKNSGVLLHSNLSGVKFRVSENDFISCKKGIVMDKGSAGVVQIMTGAFMNANGTDSAIIYRPSSFTSFSTILIITNQWNNIGKYIEGFDFTRSDGRDANAVVEKNIGMADKNPSCNIGVLNNATTTSTNLTSTWYKANWTNTSSSTCKWTIANNKITYQPANRRKVYIIISGNISASANAIVNLGIVKNGQSSTRYGETTLKISISNTAYQFSTVVFVPDVGPGDYFELWVNSNASGSTVTVQDIQWFVNTQ